ncbi:MAG TPA: ferrochelatase [Flavobacteriales bacterium]|nr:ferrochelatase [Flavobacteriales bacterium]HCA82487.1 ferrochelatase [Flavobacteriales bacterium]HRE73878.1 ferrochelatase [Flavobacteriales bacterium]HRE98131.1 ferrochelatase [Flavobacteriales bacterium]HRJ35057.1 ferrochelatase [Flavobacteriales bacterium]
MKTAILLLNLGTPDSTKTSDVRKYLREFLMDGRVIDINPVGRWMLVNLIIAPFRAPKSAKEYRKLWTPQGSPLLLHGLKVKEDLQKILPENYSVEFAMRYQNPSMQSVLEKMSRANYDRIIILPLYPQNASSTTGSSLEKAMQIISKWWVIPEIKMISQYYDHPKYIQAFVERGREHDLKSYDHVVFSFHGVPERHVDKVYFDNRPCKDHHCEEGITDENKFCYKATCYNTAKRIAAELNISEYTVVFQSRLGRDPWLEPYADKTIEQLAKNGVKRLLVFSPAFVADCLETTVEIGEAYKEMFEEHGGEHLQLVNSLNDHPTWVECLRDLAMQS